MLKLRSDLLGLAPLFLFLSIFSIRTIMGTAKYGGYPLIISIALLFIYIFVIVGFLTLFRTRMWARILLSIGGYGLIFVGLFIAIIGEMKGLYYLIGLSLCEGIYGVIISIDLFRNHSWKKWKNEKDNEGKPFSYYFCADFIRKKSLNRKVVAIYLTMMVLSVGLSQVWQFDTRTQLSFEISEKEMAEKEIVLYWVRQNMSDPQAFVNVLKDTNTVLALQGNPDLFQEIGDYTVLGGDAANLVKLCNIAGVKVEVWPVPSKTMFCALSMDYVSCMPTVYNYFKAWCLRYNITVDYYAFDIEDYKPLPQKFENSTGAQFVDEDSPLYWTYRGIYEKAAKQEFIRTNRSDWDNQIAQQQKLVDQIIADGIIPRGTIQPSAWDALDGDYKDFIKNNMQSYEIVGYDYLSGMYYRSCEWGNNDDVYIVYQNAKILKAISPYARSAICIGCIGYPAYQTAATVANDVWVSAGVGVDSMRLFLGDSWVYRADNESVGIQDLRSMLELCRKGGTGITNYDSERETHILGTVMNDVIEDF
jgi:hypothetical protein